MRNILFVLLISALVAYGSEYDWHQWRGPNRDGISEEGDWLSNWNVNPPTELWRINVGVGFSAVSISNGRAFTMGNKEDRDIVYCIDAETGDIVWEQSYPCKAGDYPGPRMTPTIDDDRVYTLSREGHLLCLNADNGEILWSKMVNDEFGSKTPTWGYACSPAVFGNMLIIDLGFVLALDKMNGDLIWKSTSHPASYSSPYIFESKGKNLVATFNATGLSIVDLTTGEELKSVNWKTEYDVNAVTPIVHNDRVFISSGYNTGCALVDISRNMASILWQNKEMRNHFNSCVLWQGNLYGFDETVLKCMDFETGAVEWEQKGFGKGSLMLADGRLIVMSEKGVLIAARATPDGFVELGRTERILTDKVCWTMPVLSNGRIYCRGSEGNLVCLDVSKK